MFEIAPLCANVWLLALTLIAAFTDARSGIIPNWLTLSSLLLAPLVQLRFAGPGAFAFSLAAIVGCSIVPLLLFGMRAIGGGDVKLFAAIGAIAGTDLGLQIQLASYALLAFCGLCVLAYRRQMLATLGRALSLLTAPLRTRTKRGLPPPEALISMRLGPAIFGAAVALAIANAMGT